MHLFAGGGGGLLSDLILGHRPIIAVEWEPYACQILRERAADGWFPDLQVWEGDVRLFNPSEYAERVDCIHAGFPCQDISVAGKQAGLGEGTRSGLYREVLRIVREVNEIRARLGLTPVKLFLENVSAILSNGLGTVLGDLAEMGYDCKWLCIRASDVGAPHGRDRWFALAHAKSAGVWGVERDIHKADGGQDGQMCQQSIGTSKEPSNMADTTRKQCNGFGDNARISMGRGTVSESGNSGGKDEIPDTSSTGLEGQRNITSGVETQQHNTGNYSGREVESRLGMLADGMDDWMDANKEIQNYSSLWWQEEPDIGRVTTGGNKRSHQLKALGNGQVPLQAAVAWKLLGGE